MKSNKRLLPLLITAVVVLAACSKKGPSYTQYIPKDASYVVAVDVKSMITKLEKDSLTVENMLEVMKDANNPSKYTKAIEIWKQFKDAGLDFDNKIMLAVPSVNMNAGNIDVEVLGGLKDEAKLEAFIAKMPEAPKVTKEAGLSYAQAEEWLIGWNKDAVMMIGGYTTPKMPAAYMDDSSGSTYAPAPVPGGGTARVDKMKKYFALKKEESIASVSAFTDFISQPGDMSIYTNSGGIAGAQAGMGLAMMPKVKELLEGIYSTTILNFEDGKMVMQSNTFTGSKLSELLKKYAGPKVDVSLIDAYPSTNVDGVAAFSFNPELIPALLKETGFDGIVDLGLTQQGLTTADIVKAFKGDFAMVFSDFTMSNIEKTNYEGEKYMANDASAKMLVAIRIGDKPSFEKLIGLAVKTGMFTRQGNRLMPVSIGADDVNKMALGIENDLLIFSNDEAIYKNYVAKTSKIGLSDAARSSINGTSIAFYMDAEKMLKSIPESVFDSTGVHEKKVFAKSKDIFKTLSFTTGNFDGTKIPGSGALTMIAADKNSLPQLVRFLMYAAEEMKLKTAEDKAKWHDKEEMNNDSSMVEPVH